MISQLVAQQQQRARSPIKSHDDPAAAAKRESAVKEAMDAVVSIQAKYDEATRALAAERAAHEAEKRELLAAQAIPAPAPAPASAPAPAPAPAPAQPCLLGAGVGAGLCRGAGWHAALPQPRRPLRPLGHRAPRAHGVGHGDREALPRRRDCAGRANLPDGSAERREWLRGPGVDGERAARLCHADVLQLFRSRPGHAVRPPPPPARSQCSR